MSETVLLYFSGTGNSLTVAQDIAGHLKQAVVVPMLKAEVDEYIEEDTERVGLIYPIHMNAVPRAVVKFIKRLRCATGKYIFAVATHGGIPGKSGLHREDIIIRKSVRLT